MHIYASILILVRRVLFSIEEELPYKKITGFERHRTYQVRFNPINSKILHYLKKRHVTTKFDEKKDAFHGYWGTGESVPQSI